MRELQGWFLPDTDTDFDRWLVEGEYQKKQRDTILRFLEMQDIPFENCMDVGAHVGFWLRDLCKKFKNVYAFEPISDVRECLEKNITSKNYKLFPFALGNENKTTRVNYIPEATGNTYISDDGNREIELKRLDEVTLPKIEYIKIDAEGYEIEVLKGGKNLIEKDKPFIHVEMKNKVLIKQGLTGDDIIKYFESINYKRLLSIKSEHVYGPKWIHNKRT